MNLVENKKITKYSSEKILQEDDLVAVESAVNISVNGQKYCTCFCSPENLSDLAVGVCFTNELITDYSCIIDVEIQGNNVAVKLNTDKKPVRAGVKVSSTGAANIEQLLAWQKEFLSRQKLFSITGGTHAVGIYAINGECLAFAEDVGRHNALDKCIGKILKTSREREAYVVFLSSRISHEMMTKISKIGVQIVAGVSAPTTMAISDAEQLNVTLIGFMRNQRCNIYTPMHSI